MIRQYNESDIDEVMYIWPDANINVHNFIHSDYWCSNYGMVREMISNAEIYVYEDECTN